MEKVITINDWWDGPLRGMAYYNGDVCIYERIFDEAEDEWSEDYCLTPIDSDAQSEILNQWKEWCEAVSSNSFDNYYAAHSNSKILENAVERSPSPRKYKKKAIFYGECGDGFIPINYTVEWI